VVKAHVDPFFILISGCLISILSHTYITSLSEPFSPENSEIVFSFYNLYVCGITFVCLFKYNTLVLIYVLGAGLAQSV
jgi:hypothetical protein